MHALILENYGGQFVYREMDKPTPDYGEVLVRVKASGVDSLDAKIKAGLAEHVEQPLPAILGIDMAGVVVEVGEGVTGFVPGDKVYGMTGGVAGLQGSLAEYVAVDAELIARKPANLTMREAAAIPLGFITAWEGLVDKAKVYAGQKVLILGGSGGVGQMAIQIAKTFGADVYATDNDSKKAVIEWLGATYINNDIVSEAEYIDKYTSGAGFDIVFDTVGAAVDGSALLPMLTGIGREHQGAILREATKMAEAGQILPLLDPRHFHLKTAEQAHTLIVNRGATGKIVVEI